MSVRICNRNFLFIISHDSIVLLVVPVKDLVARAIRANSSHSLTTFNARPNRTAVTIPRAMGNPRSVPLHCQGPIKRDATKELRYPLPFTIGSHLRPIYFDSMTERFLFLRFERVALYQRRVHWIDLSRMELDGVLFNEQHHSEHRQTKTLRAGLSEWYRSIDLSQYQRVCSRRRLTRGWNKSQTWFTL